MHVDVLTIFTGVIDIYATKSCTLVVTSLFETATKHSYTQKDY